MIRFAVRLRIYFNFEKNSPTNFIFEFRSFESSKVVSKLNFSLTPASGVSRTLLKSPARVFAVMLSPEEQKRCAPLGVILIRVPLGYRAPMDRKRRRARPTRRRRAAQCGVKRILPNLCGTRRLPGPRWPARSRGLWSAWSRLQ